MINMRKLLSPVSFLAILTAPTLAAAQAAPAADSAEPAAPKTPPADADKTPATAPESPSQAAQPKAEEPPAKSDAAGGSPAETEPAEDQKLQEPNLETAAAGERSNQEPERTPPRTLSAIDTPAAAAAPPPEGPAPDPIGLSVLLVSDNVWLTEDSFDLFSDDDVAGSFGFGLEFDLVHFSRSLSLALGANYAAEKSTNGSLVPQYLVQAELDADHLIGTATLRYEITPWLAPHLRGFGGASFVTTQLDTADRSVEAESTTPTFGAGAGVRLLTPRGFGKSALRVVQFGVLAEGGVAFGSPLELDLGELAAAEDPSEGGRRGALRGANLGEVKRTGPFLRVSGVVKF